MMTENINGSKGFIELTQKSPWVTAWSIRTMTRGESCSPTFGTWCDDLHILFSSFPVEHDVSGDGWDDGEDFAAVHNSLLWDGNDSCLPLSFETWNISLNHHVVYLTCHQIMYQNHLSGMKGLLNQHMSWSWDTDTCANSWAMVNAADKPLSSMTAHDEDGSHIWPRSARPKVSHDLGTRHRFCRVMRIAASWFTGCRWPYFLLPLMEFCHRQKLRRVTGANGWTISLPCHVCKHVMWWVWSSDTQQVSHEKKFWGTFDHLSIFSREVLENFTWDDVAF